MENKFSVYSYEYNVANATLEVVNSVMAEQSVIGYGVAYADKDKFKNDFISNKKLVFLESPAVAQEEIMNMINKDIQETGVLVLMQSLINAQNFEEPKADPVVAKKVNKSTACRMKNAAKEIDWFSPSQMAEAAEKGFVPTRGEHKQYPILVQDDKIKWTIEVDEITSSIDAGMEVIVFDVDQLVDAEKFLATYGDAATRPNSLTVINEHVEKVEVPTEVATEESTTEVPEVPAAPKAPASTPEIPSAPTSDATQAPQI